MDRKAALFFYNNVRRKVKLLTYWTASGKFKTRFSRIKALHLPKKTDFMFNTKNDTNIVQSSRETLKH